ncbi:MAG: chitobiase/beta-hexosaminidase C-terminal domain-containing protein [Bacteroidaceae bacterium]|nr:chitobiase/beta-hexosaminidase C-terminal domain-containing protein [Bacteroidaceae bacterium]
MKKNLLKSLLAVALLLVCGSVWGEEVTDELNQSLTGITGTNYVEWQGKKSNSDAVYAGQSAGGKESIQLRSSNSNSGVVSTVSGGKVTKIVVTWNAETADGRTLNVYGKNSAYTAATDLYDENQGTLLGTIKKGTNTELEVDEDYAFIGFRSNSGAMYLTEVKVTWEKSAVPSVAMPTFDLATGIYAGPQSVSIICETEGASIYYTLDGTDPTNESTLYTGAFTVSETTTVKAIAYGASGGFSNVAAASYTILQLKSIADVREQETGDVYTQGVVTSSVETTAYIQDSEAAICVFGIILTVGDKIKIRGTLTNYKGLLEIKDPFVVEVVSQNNSIEPEEMTIAEVLESDKQGWLVRINNAEVKSISGVNTTIAQDNKSIVVRSIPGDVEYTVGDELSLTGNIGCYNDTQIANPTDVEVVKNEKPVIVVNKDQFTLDWNAASGYINYMVEHNVEGTTIEASTDANWISNFVVKTDTVKFTIADNTTSTDRTAIITLSYEGAEENKTVTVTQKHYIADFATLPFNWEGGTSADFKVLGGIITNGLGSDYTSHSPYMIKLDDTGDYIQVKTNSQPGRVSVGVKMIGGGNSSTITVQSSADGVAFTDVEDLVISGAMNTIVNLETTETFASNDRYVRLYFTKGSNIGVGPITISEATTEIIASDVTLASDATSGEIVYRLIYPLDATSVNAECSASWITNITVGTDEVTFTTSANTGDERTAIITLTCGEITKEITVKQERFITMKTYKLAKTVESGSRYVIAAAPVDSVVNVIGAQRDNNRGVVEASVDENGTLTVSNEFEFVIEGTDNQFTIYDVGYRGYLYAASSSSNYLRTQIENDDNGVWTIEIDEETGAATVTAQGANTRNVMQYNSGSSLFSCYASASQSPVYLYQLVENTAKKGDVNGDGSVDVADVTMLVSMILGNMPVNAAANVNEDAEGAVDVADVTALVSIILGQ